MITFLTTVCIYLIFGSLIYMYLDSRNPVKETDEPPSLIVRLMIITFWLPLALYHLAERFTDNDD